MFQKGEIWAYPTDTSFGLGVRADDSETLERLALLKIRDKGKYFSLMVRDFEMLQKFAKIPKQLNSDIFYKKPLTVILKPKSLLPHSPFWPKNAVAFRICTIPKVGQKILYPITATSANESGQPAIFTAQEIKKIFGNAVHIFPGIRKIPSLPPSEILDFTKTPIIRIR